MQKKHDWSQVNWDDDNATIAAQLGCTEATVRSRRSKENRNKKPEIHKLRFGDKFAIGAWLQVHENELLDLTLEDILATMNKARAGHELIVSFDDPFEPYATAVRSTIRELGLNLANRPQAQGTSQLRDRIQTLEDEVSNLRADVDRLRRDLGAL